MAKLSDFMVSRVRVKLLKAFLKDPNEMFYVRQLTRNTNEEINAVRRELKRLEKVGFLKSENRGNRLYYYPNPSYDFYEELLNLVAKTTGLGADLTKFKARIGKIKYAFLSGKFIRHQPRLADEVDLLVVGTVIAPELAQLIRKEEQVRKAEINYTIMTLEEFQFRKERRDPFLLGVLYQSRLMIIGDEIELLSQKAKE